MHSYSLIDDLNNLLSNLKILTKNSILLLNDFSYISKKPQISPSTKTLQRLPVVKEQAEDDGIDDLTRSLVEFKKRHEIMKRYLLRQSTIKEKHEQENFVADNEEVITPKIQKHKETVLKKKFRNR